MRRLSDHSLNQRLSAVTVASLLSRVDGEPIVFSSKHGYAFTGELGADPKNKEADEILTACKWSEL